MLPPYGTEEVAEAVQNRMAREPVRVARLVVTADDGARTWCIQARLEDGRELSARYAFASREGVHTPAELAVWFVSELTTAG